MAFPLAQRIQRISEATRDVLLGISAYARADSLFGVPLDEGALAKMREFFGGQLAPPSVTQTRWYLSDLEAAERSADGGDIKKAAQLMAAAKKDGHLAGVLSTRTGGLVRLPKKFRGDEEIIAELMPRKDSARSLFDEMFPPNELAQLAADGVELGIGLGELIPVRGRDYPVMVRQDPQFLRYLWSENQWFFNSVMGLIPITPGDGQWILHTPGGRVAPWQNGLWKALGQAWIRKQHAQLHKDNWEAKLANPARVAVAPQGASETMKQAVFQQLMAWGVNTVFGLTPGYEVKLLESNGVGWESFLKTIEQSNEEFVMAIAGQKVTTDGGAGFQNSDIHKTIRADLIKQTADDLAHSLNTQGLPVFVAGRYGDAAVLRRAVSLEWDVTPPKDRNSEATSLVTAANAIQLLTQSLAGSGLALDLQRVCDQFSIPVQDAPIQARVLSSTIIDPAPIDRSTATQPAPTEEATA